MAASVLTGVASVGAVEPEGGRPAWADLRFQPVFDRRTGPKRSDWLQDTFGWILEAW